MPALTWVASSQRRRTGVNQALATCPLTWLLDRLSRTPATSPLTLCTEPRFVTSGSSRRSRSSERFKRCVVYCDGTFANSESTSCWGGWGIRNLTDW